jgi:DNA-directed RNA polymerase subunit RPC12/RpoP
MFFVYIPYGRWHNATALTSKAYLCGHCGRDVASELGDFTNTATTNMQASLYVCPYCNRPTFFFLNQQVPGELPGKPIDSLPDLIEKLYLEAQRCISVGSYTACVLTCRKLLMHIGHDKGAPESARFVEYINHLYDNHYIPPDGRGWVDYIRTKGNEANHEIAISGKEEAVGLLVLTEMLLRIIYELPSRVPRPPTP